MQKSFDNILDFTKLKDKCLFCGSTLRACLSNFLGYGKSDLPDIHSVMKNDQFSFTRNITTESYSIKSNCVIDAATNKLIISIPGSTTETIDQNIVSDNLYNSTPYIELYCPHKLCKKQYYLASCQLNIALEQNKDRHWNISGPKLYLESFKTNSLLVQNNWMMEETNIYSIANENAEPIKTPLIDFEALGNNLVNRIQTIATFH